jgi:cell division protein FtsQ
MVKKILKIALWVITGVALVVLFAFGRKRYLETPLQGISFQLERNHKNGFVQKDSIISYAEAICDLEHRAALGSVNLTKIQQLLDGNPWIEKSSAYIGLNDTLVIKAKEYEPVLRVFNQDKRSVYVTPNGVIFPSSPHYSPRVIIASGNFRFPTPGKSSCVTDSIYAQAGISEALTIAMTINQDPFLTGNIGQIYRDEQNEYELMVNNVSARVILGDTIDVDDKLSRLATLLEKYSGTEELKAYKTLNLKYKNQIVCTK